jgi:hypothetical protein
MGIYGNFMLFSLQFLLMFDTLMMYIVYQEKMEKIMLIKRVPRGTRILPHLLNSYLLFFGKTHFKFLISNSIRKIVLFPPGSKHEIHSHHRLIR